MDDHLGMGLFFAQSFLGAIQPQGTTVLVLILVVLLFLSFVLSGAEVAFFSLTFKDINILKSKQQSAYKRIVDLIEQPKILLASLLIANSFINISIIIISNLLIDNMFNFEQFNAVWVEFVIKVIAVTFLLVLFGEIMPKVLATQNNVRFAKDFGGIVYGISKNILKSIVKFRNITVKQIMKTRMDVSGVDREISFDQLIAFVREVNYSRIPVYKEDLDEVIGIIHTKDMVPHLDESATYNWHKLLRTPYFVHEQKPIEDLLKEFQSKRIHFAVVVDEFGGTSGIVTLEDILEEIIGEIKDEFDEEDSDYKKIDDNNYIFEGRVMIQDLCKVMDLPTETFDTVKGESDSLAGLVLELAGDFPKPAAIFTSGDFEFTVLEVAKNRLQKVKVSIKRQYPI